MWHWSWSTWEDAGTWDWWPVTWWGVVVVSGEAAVVTRVWWVCWQWYSVIFSHDLAPVLCQSILLSHGHINILRWWFFNSLIQPHEDEELLMSIFHMIVMMSDSSESISSSDLHTSVSCCRVTIVKQLISWLTPVFSVGSVTREIRNTQDPLLTSLTMIYLCKVGLNPVTQQYYLSTAQLSATSLNFMKPFIALYVVIPFAY